MRSAILIRLAAGAIYSASPARAQVPQFAPLFLSISGSGSISPFSDGDSLEVGLSYSMTAIPNAGFAFANWEPVNVFVITTSIINENGPTNITQVVRSPTPEFYDTMELTFIMQPLELVFSSPLETISRTVGWQANFEAVPEPSGIAVSLAGFAVVAFFRAGRMGRTDGNANRR